MKNLMQKTRKVLEKKNDFKNKKIIVGISYPLFFLFGKIFSLNFFFFFFSILTKAHLGGVGVLEKAH